MSDTARSIPRVVVAARAAKESRNERFRRLATKRMQDACARLDRVGALERHRNAYSPQEAQQIVQALRASVDDVERRLIPTSTPKFSFD